MFLYYLFSSIFFCFYYILCGTLSVFRFFSFDHFRKNVSFFFQFLFVWPLEIKIKIVCQKNLFSFFSYVCESIICLANKISLFFLNFFWHIFHSFDIFGTFFSYLFCTFSDCLFGIFSFICLASFHLFGMFSFSFCVYFFDVVLGLSSVSNDFFFLFI